MQKKRHQSHGLSPQEIKELQYQQVNGEAEKIKANKDSSVEINKADEHLIHVRIEAREFSAITGEKTSIPVIQNFYPKEFETMDAQGAFAGKSVEIVHEPTAEKAETAKLTSTTSGGTGSKGDEGKGGEGSANTGEKPLSRMSKAELQAEYKKLFGEDAPEGSTNPELLDAIKEEKERVENEGKGGEGEAK